MTNEPSPRPWSLFVHGEQEGGDGEISICAGGEWIATMNLRRSTAKDDAALIVDAVNFYDATVDTQLTALLDERDRLRDLVRRLTDSLQGIMDAADGNGEGVLDESLLREARAAIGEKKE